METTTWSVWSHQRLALYQPKKGPNMDPAKQDPISTVVSICQVSPGSLTCPRIWWRSADQSWTMSTRMARVGSILVQMYMYMCVYVYIYIFMCTYILTWIDRSIDNLVRIHLFMCIYMQAPTQIGTGPQPSSSLERW